MKDEPPINSEVLVTPINDWPSFEFVGRVNGYRGEFVVVIDQDGDAWDVCLDQIEYADQTGVCTTCGKRFDPNSLEYHIEEAEALCIQCALESGTVEPGL
jgi:hypothetical protein